jgi:hypothetical protein
VETRIKKVCKEVQKPEEHQMDLHHDHKIDFNLRLPTASTSSFIQGHLKYYYLKINDGSLSSHTCQSSEKITRANSIEND